MKRLLSITLALLTALFCLSGCSKEPAQLAAGYDPRILFLLDGGRSPESFINDIPQMMKERLGGEITLVPSEPEEAAAALSDGSMDFYIGITDRFAESDGISSSAPLFSIETLAVGLPSRGTQELAGANAVGFLGSSAFDAAKDDEGYHSIAQILVVAGPADTLGSVVRGEADFAVLDEINARALTESLEREYVIYDRPLYSAEVKVFAARSNEYRREILSAAKWLTRKNRLAEESMAFLGADITK